MLIAACCLLLPLLLLVTMLPAGLRAASCWLPAAVYTITAARTGRRRQDMFHAMISTLASPSVVVAFPPLIRSPRAVLIAVSHRRGGTRSPLPLLAQALVLVPGPVLLLVAIVARPRRRRPHSRPTPCPSLSGPRRPKRRPPSCCTCSGSRCVHASATDGKKETLANHPSGCSRPDHGDSPGAMTNEASSLAAAHYLADA